MTYYRNRYIYEYLPIKETDDMIIKLHNHRGDKQVTRLVNIAMIKDVYGVYDEQNNFVRTEINTPNHTICVDETPDEIYDIIYKPRY